MTNRFNLYGASALILSLLAVAPAVAQTAEAAIGGADAGDIIVTANKRNERELDIAGAIKAFGGDQLLAQGLTSLKDYATLTPGLQLAAGFGNGAPIIRGISTGLDTGTLTGIVVNGAQMGPSGTTSYGAQDSLDLDPIDLQRVEVLKGPQGTLYGANTLGGLISYTLREPDLGRVTGVARAGVETTEHGAASWSIRGAVSAPLIEDRLGIRLSGYRNRKGGFVDNDVRGIENQNDGTTWGLNGSLLAKPNDRLKIMLSGFYQDIDNNRDTVIYSFATAKPRNGDLRYGDYLYPRYRSKVRAVVATIDYDLDFAQLTSISAYQRTKSRNLSNASGGSLAQTLPVLAAFGGVPVPTPSGVNTDINSSVKKFTQEVRLSSTGEGPVQWIVGGYYAHEDDGSYQTINVTDTSGVPITVLAPAIGFDIPTTYREYAGFGNLTYKFSEAFDLTGGIRVSQLNQSYQQNFFGADAAAFNALLVFSGLAPTPASAPKVRGKKSVVNYLATARYHFSEDGMIFARFATGFRPGGPNLAILGLPATYKPDTTQNYEAGIKTKFWDGKATLDVTGYYTKWKDIIVGVGAGGVAGFGNGGNARIYGVESAFTLRPVSGLTLSGTLAYSNAEIDKLGPLGASSGGVGDPLPYNPRWSGSFSGEYLFPLSDDWKGVVAGTARFVGKREATLRSNTLIPNYTLPSYSLFDVRTGVQSDRLDIDLFIRNLTDKRAQLGVYTYYGFPEVTVQRPRTIGAALTVRY